MGAAAAGWPTPIPPPVGWPVATAKGRAGWRPAAKVAVAAGAVAALTISAALAFGRSDGPSSGALTGSQLLQRSLEAAGKAGTVHVTAAEDRGGEVVKAAIDLSPSGGTETVSFADQSVEVISVGASVFLRADSAFLSAALGASGAVASEYSGRWISMPAGTQEPTQTAQQLETPTVINDLLRLVGPISKGTGPARGQVTLVGTVANNPFNEGSGAGDRGTLTVSTGAPFLPLALSFSDPENGSTQFAFTDWGERFAPTAPSGAVPLASLGLSLPGEGPGTSPDSSVGPAAGPG
jgi:hypothetical protein